METIISSHLLWSKNEKALSENDVSKKNGFLKPGKEGQPFSITSQKDVTLFLVDDDPFYLKTLEHSIHTILESATVYSFQTGEACLQQMRKKPMIVILDYYLNSETPYAWDGLSILKQIKKISPKTKVIMLSAQENLNVAIECMNNGAYDYISKTQTAFTRLNNIVKNIVANSKSSSLFFRICEYLIPIIILTMIAYALLKH